MDKNYALSIVSRYQGIWDAPPVKVPSIEFSDAPLLGNGDVGIVIGGNADAMMFYFGKNEFISQNEGIPKALSRIQLSFPEMSGCSYHMEQQLLHGQAVSRHTRAAVSPAACSGTDQGAVYDLSLKSWMQATDSRNNLFFVEMKNEGNAELNGSITCYPGIDNYLLPMMNWKDGVLWQDVRADLQNQIDGYDTPRARIALSVIAGEAVRIADSAISFTLLPGQTAWLAFSIMSIYDDPAYQEISVENIRQLTPAAILEHYKAHCGWWEDFWSCSYVEIPQKDIEKEFYGSLYLLACCLREGETSPTLYGNWVMRNLLWAGSPPLNYNYEAPYYCTVPTNHAELSDNYENLLFNWRDQARKNAAAIGCSGLYYEGYPGPLPNGVMFSATRWIGLDYFGRDCFMGQKSNALYASSNMVLRYFYTRDAGYAAKVYPFLKEVGDFWLDYLTWDGTRYIIENDYNHEGPNSIYPQTNPILSLGLLRLLLQGLLTLYREMGTRLDIPSDLAAQWQHHLEHLSEYPVFERNGQTVFRNQESGESRAWSKMNGCDEDFSVWSTPGAIPEAAVLYPAGQIGRFSDPALLKIAQDTVTQQAKWKDANMTCFFYPSAARAVHDPQEILSRLSNWLAETAYPNMAIHAGGGGIENLNAVPAALVEMLCQSYQGRLWVFPCWPSDCPARFGGLMAYGGFLVSSELRDGRVTHIQVESQKGRELTFVNPWPGRKVQISYENGNSLILEGEEISVETKIGQTVMISEVF